jgi:FMN phosphatase YigB (HAD superfamily)
MKKRVAFFDIDGTLFRSSLLIELVERMLDRGLFPKEAERVRESALDEHPSKARSDA